jgi:hypothetical protein
LRTPPQLRDGLRCFCSNPTATSKAEELNRPTVAAGRAPNVAKLLLCAELPGCLYAELLYLKKCIYGWRR